MANYARIINNVAVDVSSNPDDQFHPDIAAEFVAVPDSVHTGWRLVDGTWEAPAPVIEPPPVVVYPKVSPVEFKLLFTSAERVAIKAARATDPAIDDFYEIIEDPRLTFVDLGLQSTQDALAYMISVNLLTEARSAAILTGVLQ